MTKVYGDETAKMVNYFTGLFGIAPNANLTVFETEAGAPNGYAAPGLIFLNQRTVGHDVNSRVLANEVSRQWWSNQVSAGTRNHLWLDNGLACLFGSIVGGASDGRGRA